MPRPGEGPGRGEEPEGRQAESSEGTQGQLQQQEWIFQSGIGDHYGSLSCLCFTICTIQCSVLLITNIEFIVGISSEAK